MAKRRSHLIMWMIFLLAACGNLKLPTPATPTLAVENLTQKPPTFSATLKATLAASLAAVVKTPTPTPTPTAVPRYLSICLGEEPKSLFLYDAASTAARSVLAAVYDGPFKLQNFNNLAVIVERTPSLASGDSLLAPVTVQPGDALVDANGNPGILAEGVLYRPSGCAGVECAQTYSGNQAVQMDQWRLRFQLRLKLKWSDGQALTADDSVYSYEVASALYPAALPALVRRTQSYKALDAQTVEWRGLPGYQDGDTTGKFFSPLPRHAWSIFTPQELRSQEISYRLPIGWGPYILDEWTAGDHITLHRNPNYFRASEGLPHFDHLVFRFVPNSQQALDALLAGECDVVDQNALENLDFAKVQDLQKQGKVALFIQPDTAWEVLTFGMNSLDNTLPPFFKTKEVRQAVAVCIDRSAIAASLALGQPEAAESYIPAANPLFNADTARYPFDPKKGNELLRQAGWIDLDNNPATPRTARSVDGVADGTPFEVQYLTSDEPERKSAAGMLQASLAQCGIGLKIVSQPASTYLAAGPDGPVFGRRFSLAEFAWPATIQPPCSLYLSAEIPGPLPDFPKGWGGANAGGYNSAEFDRACKNGLFSLSDAPEHRQAHLDAQKIFMQDLPAIPLYWHTKLLLTRPDLCGIALDASSPGALWNIELLDYGETCR